MLAAIGGPQWDKMQFSIFPTFNEIFSPPTSFFSGLKGPLIEEG